MIQNREFHKRTIALLGEDALEKLNHSHVVVFGLGGVGGHAAESLVRGGVGAVTLVDSECYEISNCNRQLFATKQTVGVMKTQAAKDRLLEIAPECRIRTFSLFYGKDTSPADLFENADYIIDAIDTVSAKMLLIRTAKENGIPIISCMGTGNKIDPTAFRVTDIAKTKTCPLARVIRTECKKLGISGVKVVYSEEVPMRSVAEEKNGRNIPGSTSFVPGVAGMILAGEVIKDLIGLC